MQFLIVGAALTVASTFTSKRDVRRDDQIVVSAGQVEHLAARFARTWRRPPTFEELEGLVNDYVREEAAYREGIALGLDRDDAIIRRRIRQKLDFIATDVAGLVEPTSEDLESYLAAHTSEFRVPPRYTFLQVYLDPAQRGDRIATEARELLETLRRDPDADVREFGDPTLLGIAFQDVSAEQLSNVLGQEFADALEALDWPTENPPGHAVGRWYGPIASGYGLHLVRADARSEGRLPGLEEIVDQVRREWENARHNEVKERFYADLLDRYRVTVEWPDLQAPGEAK